jgi:hypothetical protein
MCNQTGQLCTSNAYNHHCQTRFPTILLTHDSEAQKLIASREAAFLASKLFGDMSAGVKVLIQADKATKLSTAKVAIKRTSIEGSPSGPYWPNTATHH